MNTIPGFSKGSPLLGRPQDLAQSLSPLFFLDPSKCNTKLTFMSGIHYLQGFPQAVLRPECCFLS